MNNKERILEFLKKGKSAISKISVNLGLNYYLTKEILDELEKEGKVENEINFSGAYKYYKLK